MQKFYKTLLTKIAAYVIISTSSKGTVKRFIKPCGYNTESTVWGANGTVRADISYTRRAPRFSPPLWGKRQIFYL